MNLLAQIEAVLFFKSEPVAVKKLAAMLKTGEDDVLSALAELETTLAHRGIALVRNGDEVELRTAPAVSALIESLTKEELSRDLGKAGLETIAIILYKSSAKRNDIDYIRGVNSSFILRNLLIRGLIERESDGGRGFLYKPTTDLLAHMGVAKLEQLPEFDKVKEALASFEEASVE